MYEVRVSAKPERLAIDYCHPKRSISQPVILLYSKTADLTIAIGEHRRSLRRNDESESRSLNRVFLSFRERRSGLYHYRKISSFAVFAKDSVAEALAV